MELYDTKCLKCQHNFPPLFYFGFSLLICRSFLCVCLFYFILLEIMLAGDSGLPGSGLGRGGGELAVAPDQGGDPGVRRPLSAGWSGEPTRRRRRL